jgi:hypothetical protein
LVWSRSANLRVGLGERSQADRDRGRLACVGGEPVAVLVGATVAINGTAGGYPHRSSEAGQQLWK